MNQHTRFRGGWSVPFAILILGSLIGAGHGQAPPAPLPSDSPPQKAHGEDLLKSPAAAAWEAAYGEWKDVVATLRAMRVEYITAEEEELPKIESRYKEYISKGEALLDRLRARASEAYREAPNVDAELTRFLVKMGQDDLKRDDYEAAYEIGEMLVEHDCADNAAAPLAGVAAFGSHHFEDAERFFSIAQQNNALEAMSDDHLNGMAQKFSGEAADYQKYWQTEQELRERERRSDDLPRVKLTTNKGDMVLELFENEAPQTVGNFVHLVEQGFYDGLTFHRVIPGFVAQGGCPKGDGSGGPGYRIYCECYKGDHRKHFSGSLSMAHAGRDTGGSQFFIALAPTPNLNGRHTVFGRVIEGLDVARSLQPRDPSKAKNEEQEAMLPEPDKIVKAEVLRKRPDTVYRPTKVQ